MAGQIYISELLEHETIKKITADTGVGFESIQFSIGDNLDHLTEEIKKARLTLHELGNPSLSLHGPFLDLNPMSYDSNIRKVCLKRYNECYIAAKELGARRIIYHSGMVPAICCTIGWAERIADFYQEFLEDKEGIPIMMENVFDPEIIPFLEAAQRIKHPDFGICLDVGHAHCFSNHQVDEWATTLAPYIRHLHLHDNDGTKDQHLAIGEGSIDFSFLNKLLSKNPNMEMTVECNTDFAIRESLAYIQKSKTKA